MPKTRAQIAAEIAANLPNNTSGAITPQLTRDTLTDIAAAAPNIADAGTPITNTSGTLVVAHGGTGATTVNGALDALITAEISVASAATTDLGAVSSQNVIITGTTSISSFGTAAVGLRRFGRFSGIVTLQHNATSLILPASGSNITSAAGDRFFAMSLGSGNWLVYFYQRASGASLAGSPTAWGAITGTLGDQTDLAAALALKAPLLNPVFTNSFRSQVFTSFSISNFNNSAAYLVVDAGGVKAYVPFLQTVRTIGNSDSTTIGANDAWVQYSRSDATDIVMPNTDDRNPGCGVVIGSTISDPVEITAPNSGQFYDGVNGVVDSITIAPFETICFGFIDTTWRILARYLSPGGGGGGTVDVGLQDFRLTTESGVPVSPSDRTAQSTIYFTPYAGNQISLYSGSAWATYSTAEISLALSGLTTDSNYDVFVYNNAGTITLELSTAWSGPNTPTDSIVLQNGIPVKSGATTRRWIGTIRTTGATTTEDSDFKRFACNLNNQVNRRGMLVSGTANTYSTTTWREWNGGVGGPYRVSFVCCNAQTFNVNGAIEMNGFGPSYASFQINGTTTEGFAGVAIDQTETLRLALGCIYQSLAGFNQVIAIQYSNGSGTYNNFRLNCLLKN